MTSSSFGFSRIFHLHLFLSSASILRQFNFNRCLSHPIHKHPFRLSPFVSRVFSPNRPSGVLIPVTPNENSTIFNSATSISAHSIQASQIFVDNIMELVFIDNIMELIVTTIPMTSFEPPVDILRLFVVELATEPAELFLQEQINSYQRLRLNYFTQSLCEAISFFIAELPFAVNRRNPVSAT